jgi:hypothetical protein
LITPPVYGGQGGDLGSIKPGDLRTYHRTGSERAKPPVREASCLHSVLKGKEGTSENGGVFDNSPRLRGARGGSWFDQTWRPAVTYHLAGSERAKPPVREASCLHSVLKGREGTSENGGVFDNSPRLRGARGGSWFDQTWRLVVASPRITPPSTGGKGGILVWSVRSLLFAKHPFCIVS